MTFEIYAVFRDKDNQYCECKGTKDFNSYDEAEDYIRNYIEEKFDTTPTFTAIKKVSTDDKKRTN